MYQELDSILFTNYFKYGNIDKEHKLFGSFSLQPLHLRMKDEGYCDPQKWDMAFGERGEFTLKPGRNPVRRYRGSRLKSGRLAQSNSLDL
jgi:hypothetical protein